MTKTILSNSHVRVDRTDTDFTWYDLHDKYNDFKGFTRGKRNLSKAEQFITQLANDERLKHDLNMSDITSIMEKFNLKPHTYCGMD